MACSKILSGDLPELTYDIIKYLLDDFSTLHSCILVNRLWCRLAIPLLWENPFSIPTKNYKFIEIYLLSLNDDFETKPSNTLFNYPSFLKYLNIWKFMICVEIWSRNAIRTLKPERYFIYDTYKYSKTEFMKLISISLFKIFIENEVTLHTLDIDISDHRYYCSYFNDIFELILQNGTNFIHNIKNLKFCTSTHSSFDNEDMLLKNRISQIIDTHQNLKIILLCHNYLPLYQSLLLSKNSNCSNTLNTIMFYHINFGSIFNIDILFEQLNVLESVHIFFCYSLNSFIQKIINLPKPFKLKSLFINEKLRIELLPLLLQKSGDYLENFECELNYDEQRLLELITKYCKNIKFLDIYGFENHFTSLIFNLIENIKQNLNYLSIGVDYQNGNIESNSILLQNLGQILPPKLEYLNLVLYFKVNDFKVFLRNSQGTFIKKLLINQKGSDDILHCIKEFIMKEKRVKYLAIRNSNDGELRRFENEAKEFELYNIKLQYYYAIFIYSYNYMKELY
ncbi:uncharacterized protein OCT59_019096 [Rhizophagus irregularis]|uniref:F-box domain-containing protein n=1 Tax=Rhizophagus irregularis (strain DAOM 181602 / DAOM 197198 / MUCL 43194) TaxID=747089 RepID=A0A2H5SUL7_RHIID|nr:hypothetical protein GLOIN_2v1886068 [Rhizophagus irregularis DAOM 181602=DAOM 197198]POG58136.1 hypothetical protein GLOIN_2v1886068 [Rhizophagus irregularis DAOM 181602=DAOM 197198]UZO26884.1 hypothetical protein OCT59_019096 [Rhizophagus irregularis]GBC34021.1 hypothetical protein GLOIN_2v1886068 [Rhizophagus irregularis DAOM 181602=DAOM 197198]|eukprot:XP_025165002.1 hypothetical protein GLOIN_2v1886068 [Rhizophagus irregularis DAOM 181602=DAOM 197198]